MEILITTKNSDVHTDLVNMLIEGVKCRAPLQKIVQDGDIIYQVFVTLSLGTASSLFAAWLYDIIKKWGDKSTCIDGQKIPPYTVVTSIHIETMINTIVLNNNAESSPEKEDKET